MACTLCNIELHSLCSTPSDYEECCCNGRGYSEDFAGAIRNASGKRGRRQLTGEVLKDVLSSGRHRAATIIPDTYFAGQPICAWAGLANAGGGVRPVIGCAGNVATDRHHGPDKSVLNNDEDYGHFGINLHAICSWCHNRWHFTNDKYYLPVGWKKGDPDPRPGKGKPWLPVEKNCLAHDPDTLAPGRLVLLHDKWWKELTTAEREEMGGYFNDSAWYDSGSEHPLGEGDGQDSSEPGGSIVQNANSVPST